MASGLGWLCLHLLLTSTPEVQPPTVEPVKAPVVERPKAPDAPDKTNGTAEGSESAAAPLTEEPAPAGAHSSEDPPAEKEKPRKSVRKARHKTTEAPVSATAAKAEEASPGDPPASTPGAKSAVMSDDTILEAGVGRASLCEELTKSAQDRRSARKAIEADRKALATERTKLEQMAADIAKARAALRDETTKLELAMKSGAEAKANEAAGRGPPPEALAKAQVDAMAKAFKSMKSEQAAGLLSRLHPTISTEILKRMRPADAGSILEKLKPELAVDLMTRVMAKEGKGGS